MIGWKAFGSSVIDSLSFADGMSGEEKQILKSRLEELFSSQLKEYEALKKALKKGKEAESTERMSLVNVMGKLYDYFSSPGT